jgi:hypothetical protein
MADIFGSVALMCGLGCSGFLHWQVTMAMLVAFLVLSSESYLAAYSLSSFELSQGFFGPTEIRILLAIGNLALLRSPYATIFGHRMLLFDMGGTIAATGMSAMALSVALRHTAELYRQEPLPRAASPGRPDSIPRPLRWGKRPSRVLTGKRDDASHCAGGNKSGGIEGN